MFQILRNCLRSASQPAGLLCHIWQDGGRAISTTSALYAEPPRKKRRIDPALFKIRVERKMKKLEREIEKLEAEPKQLVPILEYQLTNPVIRDLNARPKHEMSEFGLTEKSLKAAQRLWTFYRIYQSRMDGRNLAKIERAQTRALEHMKEIDQELYDETVSVDDTILIPYRSSHMRRETGPNADYKPPDGIVKDVTKEWVM